MNNQRHWVLYCAVVAVLGASCRSKPSDAETASAPVPSTDATVLSASPPRRLPPSGRSIFGRTCPGDEVAKCLQRYTKPKLSPADVRRVFDEVRSTCFAQGDADKLAAQGACLPLTIGMDSRNSQIIELIYRCSDVCPNQGRIVIRYVDVAKGVCCELGGYPIRNRAWGDRYGGCSPPEMPLSRFNYPRPDGTMGLATESPCNPSKITFVDDDAGP
jgi:hypothetical protein